VIACAIKQHRWYLVQFAPLKCCYLQCVPVGPSLR
jgi:hypothetical protein